MSTVWLPYAPSRPTEVTARRAMALLGNVIGSHVEVRPGGGDPVDPRAAFAAAGMPF